MNNVSTRYLVKKKFWVPTLTVLVSGGLMALSAFPGWMSPDSISMWQQAIGQAPLTDRHTPWLTMLWTLLNPTALGAIGPVAIQQVVFWFGTLLFALYCARQSLLVGSLVGPIMLVLDHNWVLAWAWKDGTVLALSVLAISGYFWSLEAKSSNTRLTIAAISTLAFGLAATVRIYMLPAFILTLAFVIIAVVKSAPDSRRAPSIKRQPWITRGPSVFVAGVLLVAFGLGVGIPLVAQKVIGKPQDSYSMGATFVFDLARVYCTSESSETLGSLPAVVLEAGQEIDCTRFNPANAWSVLVNPAGEYVLNLPNNKTDFELVRGLWVSSASDNWQKLLGHRAVSFVNFLRLADGWIVWGMDLSQGRFFPPEMVTPPETGVVNSDERWLFLARLPVAILSSTPAFLGFLNSGFLSCLLLPMISIFLLARRPPSTDRTLAMGFVFFPVIWLIGLSLISPWEDTRYLSVAATIGWLVALQEISKALKQRSSRRKLQNRGGSDCATKAEPTPIEFTRIGFDGDSRYSTSTS